MPDAQVRELTPADVRARLDAGEPLTLLDCREPEEVAIAALPGALNIPMGDIPVRLGEIDPDRELIVFCHHGIRSTSVALWLQEQAGCDDVATMAGGIDRWSLEIDPTVPRY